MHRALQVKRQPCRLHIQRSGGIGCKIKRQHIRFQGLFRQLRLYLAHRSVVIDRHLLRLHEVRDTETVLRLRFQFQVLVVHRYREMHRTLNGLIRQSGVQVQAGDIDLLVDSVFQIQMHFAPHCRRRRVDTLAFGLQRTGKNQVHRTFEERRQINAFHLHIRPIELIVDVVKCTKRSFRALEIRLSFRLDPHRFEVKEGGFELSVRSQLLRMCMKSGAGDKAVGYIHIGASVNCIKRQIEFGQVQRETAHVQLSSVIHIPAHINQGIGGKRFRLDMHP